MKYNFLLLTGFAIMYFSPKAQSQLLVAVQQRVDSVLLYDIEKNICLSRIAVGKMPHEITYDPVGKLCFITDFGVEDYDTRIGIPGKTISVIDPYRCRLIRKIETGTDSIGNMPHGIKVRPGKSRELFVNIERGDSILVYDVDTYALKRRFSVPAGTHNFIFSGHGDKLWAIAGAQGVYELDPRDGKIIRHRKLPSPVRGIIFLKNNLLASGKDELFILSENDLSVIKHINKLGAGQILYSAVTTDGKYILCPAVYDSVVLVVNAVTGKVHKRIATDKTPINIQVTGKFAFISHAQDRHITQIDLENFEIIKRIEANGTNGLLVLTQ